MGTMLERATVAPRLAEVFEVLIQPQLQAPSALFAVEPLQNRIETCQG